VRQSIASSRNRDSLSAATLDFSSLHAAKKLTFFLVREVDAAPTKFHKGKVPYVGKEEFEVRESNLKLSATNMSRTTESSGHVRHDDRGVAVWDWALETGEFDALSSSALIRRLDVADLKVQESPGLALAIAGRDAGGGGDPYNSRCAETRVVAPRRSRDR